VCDAISGTNDPDDPTGHLFQLSSGIFSLKTPAAPLSSLLALH
jgi:hypothetical protein